MIPDPLRPPEAPTAVARAAAAFREQFGAEPRVIGAAPGRVNLIGEHTDYNAGLCLPIALGQRTAAASAPREDSTVTVRSLDIGRSATFSLDAVRPGHPSGWAGYVAGTLWALREEGVPLGGLDLVIASDVPVGAGLSSSAAIEGAVAAAADGAFGLGLLESDAGRESVIRACRRAENEIVGAPTGGLDQTAAVRGEAGHALELDFRSGQVRVVPFAISEHGLEILVIDTRAHHSLADGQYGRRRAECDDAAELLGVASLREASLDAVADIANATLRRRARHVVSEIQRVELAVAALKAEDFLELGRLFDASHASLRDDYEVSCAELDAACAAAAGAGALGARMTGGGFGGSAIALIRTEDREAVTRAVREAFAGQGWREPNLFVAEAGGGAEIVGRAAAGTGRVEAGEGRAAAGTSDHGGEQR